MLKIDVKNNTSNPKIEKLFSKKLKQNLDINHPSVEQIVINSVKDTLHDWKIMKKLGSYKKVLKNDCSIMCTLCNANLQLNQYKRALQCGHTFHKKCIDKCIFVHNTTTCPVCDINL